MTPSTWVGHLDGHPPMKVGWAAAPWQQPANHTKSGRKVRCLHHKQDDTSHQCSEGLLWLLHAEAASKAQKVDIVGVFNGICACNTIIRLPLCTDHKGKGKTSWGKEEMIYVPAWTFDLKSHLATTGPVLP